jgi:hypothetical protein
MAAWSCPDGVSLEPCRLCPCRTCRPAPTRRLGRKLWAKFSHGLYRAVARCVDCGGTKQTRACSRALRRCGDGPLGWRRAAFRDGCASDG